MSGGGRLGDGKWTCLYDTGTNGATVELVAFRNGGLEGISKVGYFLLWKMPLIWVQQLPRGAASGKSVSSSVVEGLVLLLLLLKKKSSC